MTENLNLVEILKDCPKGWKLYSPIFGEIEFYSISENYNYPIILSCKKGKIWFSKEGLFDIENEGAECLLFPSKDQRDWSKFTAPWYNPENQDEDKKEINNFDVLPGLYKCVHRMFDGTSNGRLLFEIGNVYKCLSKHNRAEFEVSYGHSVYLEDPIVHRYFIPFEGEQISSPKFKIGNWYQCTKSFYGKGVIFTKNTAYYCAQKGCLQDEYGCHIAIVKDLYDNFKLWTIQDAKDGDVLAISWLEDKNLWEKIIIFKKYHNEGVKGLYGMPCVEGYGNTFKNGKIAFTDEKVLSYSKTWTRNLRPATKVQRDVLMKAMNDAGYKWNAETKTLEKLVEPKFDPKTLKPFDKVLVRDNYKEEWSCNFFSHISNDGDYPPYITLNIGYIFCIPYNEDTKHLVGTKEEAPEYYRYWED